MADDDKKDEQELSEDEKLAAEWESAMEESGDADEDGRECTREKAGPRQADSSTRGHGTHLPKPPSEYSNSSN